ncbi:MAG TPA: tagaturonate epimerase family protein, partial [bacterium]|nr:tagaturonate epimerase family protein [bacterium]
MSELGVFGTEGALASDVAEKIAAVDSSVYTKSLRGSSGEIFYLRKIKRGRELVILSKSGEEPGAGFSGKVTDIKAGGAEFKAKICDTGHSNAVAMREKFSFARPVPLGLKTSFGMGDRIGIATPGHIRAAEKYDFAPILPQQSIREMARTGRTPDMVMDDACWGVFQEGYERPFGADADHLKTEDDVRYTYKAGFTFYTIDPSDFLNFGADIMSDSEVDSAFEKLFTDVKHKESFLLRYSGKFELADFDSSKSVTFEFTPEMLKRIAVKYLSAVRHTIKMYRLLTELFGDTDRFDFEMSVDETPTPTTPMEHLFVAVEMKRAGVVLQSLAPRYPGEFQKGIDYIGDVDIFRNGFERHALIARNFGPYKLSIHSGSDKFSVFP